MANPILYAYPNACSRASHITLELIETTFSIEFVDLATGQQNSPDYRARNPRGKVPLLADGDNYISETVSILTWLSLRFPQSRILPTPDSPMFADALSTMAWLASTVHPLITRFAAPLRFVLDEAAADGVRSIACNALLEEWRHAERHVAERDWWFDAPGALDAYLFVLWTRLAQLGFDTEAFPALRAHASRMAVLPAVERAIAREDAYLLMQR